MDYPPWEQHYQSAAVAIQRHFRRHRKQHNIDTQAAITIQRIYRGYVVRICPPCLPPCAGSSRIGTIARGGC